MQKGVYSFCGASHAILRISVLEKEFSFLGLSMWYHQRSCSNGRKEWVSRTLLSFTQRQRGISVNVQHTGHAYTPSCSSACVFCMDSFMKRNEEVEGYTAACVRVDSRWQVNINVLRTAVCFGRTSRKSDLFNMVSPGLILSRAEHWHSSLASHQPLFRSCKGSERC